MSRTAGRLVLALGLALAVLVLGPAAALAAPQVTIDFPEASPTNNPTPQLHGTTDDPFDEVSVVVERVGGGGGATMKIAPAGEEWSVSPAAALSDGEYTARATQANALEEVGESGSVTFTVDTAAPTLTLAAPPALSNETKPSFGGFASDSTTVVVRIYNSSETEVTKATASGGSSWTASNESSLSSGTYTARAEQTDQAGNIGMSNTVTFTIDTSSPTVALNQPATPSKDTKPTFSGTASDTEDVVVEIFKGGSKVASATASGTGGGWSTSNEVSLPSGTYTAVAKQASSLGNPDGKSSQVTFTIETSSPTVVLNQPATPSKNTAPSFTGTATDTTPVVVHIKKEGTEVASAEASGTGSTWTSAAASPPLSEGVYTAVATQASSLGNPSGESSQVAFTIDTSAPAPQITAPANGAFVKTEKPTISGTAGSATGDSTAVTLTITPTSGSAQKVTVFQSGGTWSYTPSASLSNGTYSAQVQQTDQAGNAGASATITFTVKTQGPAVTLNAVPTPTNNATPTLGGGTGVAQGDLAPVTVKIYAGSTTAGTLVQTLSAAVSGAGWSAKAAPLSDGITYTVQAEQFDEAGNPGKSSSSTFTIDTSAPAPQITAPANGAYVKTEKPTISGTAGSATGDSTALTLTITPTSGSAQKVTVSRSGGTWSYTPSASLSNGTYSAQVEQTDQAGNAGASATITFTVKTQGPAVTLNAVPTPTNNATPTLGGGTGVAPGDLGAVTVKIYAGSTALGTPVQTLSAAVSGAGWSAQAAHLSDGTYTVQAEQSDIAGNAGKSSSSTFTLDTVLPAVSLAPGSAEKHTATPKFEGTAGTASGDLPTVTLNIYTGSSPTGTPVRVASVVAKSGKWSVVASAALQNGTYTAQAGQADAAGNHGLSAASTFTINSNGPTVTLTPVAAETNNASPSFSGSAGLANGEVRLQVYSGSHASGNAPVRNSAVTATGSSWSSGPVAALPDGTYTAIAEETDALGNIGVSNEATFTVDTVAPGISLAAPANGSSASGTSQVVEGVAGIAAGDAATITVRLASGTSIGGQTLQTRVVPSEGGRWHVAFEGLAPGAYTTQAEQPDAAGNSALTQAVTFTLTPAPVSSAAPTAAFTWVPSAPSVGQVVTLVSSSSDATSQIVGYAWDVAGSNAFLVGAATRSTVFSTSGNHVVHLRVSAADGMSSVAGATIPVLPAAYALMRPFPIVRITSSDTRSGIRLRLLRVQAPNGSRISVTCHNRGCPVRSQQKLAAAAATGVAGYTFRKFQRALRAGVVLEIRVSAANQIGKYTRLTIRKGKLPQRVDRCLSPGGAKTMACPS